MPLMFMGLDTYGKLQLETQVKRHTPKGEQMQGNPQ